MVPVSLICSQPVTDTISIDTLHNLIGRRNINGSVLNVTKPILNNYNYTVNSMHSLLSSCAKFKCEREINKALSFRLINCPEFSEMFFSSHARWYAFSYWIPLLSFCSAYVRCHRWMTISVDKSHWITIRKKHLSEGFQLDFQ